MPHRPDKETDKEPSFHTTISRLAGVITFALLASHQELAGKPHFSVREVAVSSYKLGTWPGAATSEKIVRHRKDGKENKCSIIRETTNISRCWMRCSSCPGRLMGVLSLTFLSLLSRLGDKLWDAGEPE